MTCGVPAPVSIEYAVAVVEASREVDDRNGLRGAAPASSRFQLDHDRRALSSKTSVPTNPT